MISIADRIEEAVDHDSAAHVADHLLGCDEYEMQCMYAWHIGEDEEKINFKSPEISESFKAFVQEQALERLENARHDLTYDLSQNEDDTLTIWRSIVVPNDWPENVNERPIGIYWAYRETAAEPHWGSFSEGNAEIILEGRVNVEDVDWSQSVLMNAQCKEEREIRLLPTAMVLLVSARWAHDNGGPIPIGLEVSAGGQLATAAPAAT
jgi:hypothetical protein